MTLSANQVETRQTNEKRNSWASCQCSVRHLTRKAFNNIGKHLWTLKLDNCRHIWKRNKKHSLDEHVCMNNELQFTENIGHLQIIKKAWNVITLQKTHPMSNAKTRNASMPNNLNTNSHFTQPIPTHKTKQCTKHDVLLLSQHPKKTVHQVHTHTPHPQSDTRTSFTQPISTHKTKHSKKQYL